MSDEAFEKYAIKLEMEDFEDDIRNLVKRIYEFYVTKFLTPSYFPEWLRSF
jgi:hypothetical protein